MADPKPPGPLGMKDPPSRLQMGVTSQFERLLGVANTLKPVLPLGVQKDLSSLEKMHKQRAVDWGPPGARRDQSTAVFQLGRPQSPEFNFDHGFLDREGPDHRHTLDLGKKRPPTREDVELYRKWQTAALAMVVLRPDLADALVAYLHFLQGNGAPLRFAYERFLTQDSSGQRVLQSAIEDAKSAAIDMGTALAALDDTHWQRTFQIYSDAIAVGGTAGMGKDEHPDDRYPYPSTENWQKAIGGHGIWIEVTVTTGLDIARNVLTFDAGVVLHAADEYNFNPQNQDIATGIPDAVNGRFEVTGLAHEFFQTGEARRLVTFEAPAPRPAPFAKSGP